MTISRETLAKLTRFDTPTICNVIELFDVRPRNRGYMDGRVKCNFPELPPMVGFACTARSAATPRRPAAMPTAASGRSSSSSPSCRARRWSCFKTSTIRRPRPCLAR